MKKGLIIILIVGVLANLGMNIMEYTKEDKIAFVRSQDLVYGYMGMKEAQNKFQLKTDQLQANADTLKKDFQKTLSQYNEEFSSLSESERQEKNQLLQLQQNNVVQYTQNVEQQIKEEEAKILEGVLNQVNSFVEDYGKKNGYKMIFGTTLSGNILYGTEATDITDEVLAQLNQNYTGEHS